MKPVKMVYKVVEYLLVIRWVNFLNVVVFPDESEIAKIFFEIVRVPVENFFKTIDVRVRMNDGTKCIGTAALS